ncbi:hypothetical protein ACFWF7_14755 [Nocardia sp. NPDC060256]|uniref:hypothetical protein n=1 Tax=unclassified Nocardia TaxID=2637762 RepID=UPI003660908C
MADAPPKIDDTTKATYDDWEKNRANADSGTLKINGLKFEMKAVVECVQRCHDLIENLAWYQDFIREFKMNTMDPWALENGGRELTHRFNTKGDDVIETMNTMKRILEDLGDTFRSAGGGYLYFEKLNSEALDKVGDLQAALTNKVKPKTDPPSSTTLSKVSDKPNPLAPATGAGSEKSIQTESADLWPYDRYYEFSHSLTGHDQVAYDAGARYTWMGGQLTDDLAELNTALTRVNSDMWTGDGADQAVKAIERFTRDSGSFADELKGLGSDLSYCAQWLNYMLQDIPANKWDDDPAEECDKNKALAGWRERYKNAYQPGVENAVNAMPIVAVTGAAAAPPPGGNNNGSGNGGEQRTLTDHKNPYEQRTLTDYKDRNNNGGNNGNNNGGNNNGSSNNGSSNNGGNDNGGSQGGYNQSKSRGAGDASNGGGSQSGGGSQGEGSQGGGGYQGSGGSQGGGGSQGSGGSKDVSRAGGGNLPAYPNVNPPGGGNQGGGDGSGSNGGSGNGDGNNGDNGSNTSNNPQTSPAASHRISKPGPNGKPGSGPKAPPGSPQDLINKLMHGENPFKDLSPEALQQIGKDLLGGLNPDLLKNMSPEDLQKLGSDFVQHMSPEDLKKIGNDLLGGLGPDGLKGLDPDTLSKLDPETLRKLNHETLTNPASPLVKTPGGADLLKTLMDGFKEASSALTDVIKAGTEVFAGLTSNSMAGIPGIGDLQNLNIPGFDSSAIPNDIAAAFGGAHAGIPGGSGGVGGAPHAPGVPPGMVESKLFPRASVQSGLENTQMSNLQAGSTGSSGSGTPMGGGMGGGGMGGAQGGAAKEYKRPKYLDAASNMEEGLGDDAAWSKPVIEP